ncbi:MAG TPA: quercetin 2,3-dioxygenase, partial [Lautropia sp.]|nr:quercetin 2,3-dioxygenase [Lautropia sp.]
NHQQSAWTHFLQIWIIPDRSGHQPSYDQKHFPIDQRRGRLALIVSPDGAEGSLVLHQSARVYTGSFTDSEEATLKVANGRGVWVQLARGAASVNGHALDAGDGLAISDISILKIDQAKDAEVLVFDLPLN